MSMLKKAIHIAVKAHNGQKDKYGVDYILHPLRVMSRQVSESAQIVAVLHDIVEDTKWTLDNLRAEGFSEDVVFAIDCLSKQKNEDGNEEDYFVFIRRVARSPHAVAVKLADLEDNMDLRRIPELTPEAIQRLEKYHKA